MTADSLEDSALSLPSFDQAIDQVAEVGSATATRAASRLRIVELSLVLFVAFGGSVLISIYAVISGARLYGSSPSPAIAVIGVIQHFAALAVLFYVLFRQGRSVRSLGLSFSWTDLPKSLGLAVVALLASVILQVLITSGYRGITGGALQTQPKNVEFIQFSITAGTFLFVIVNPIFEELIVRAFLITEIQGLTNSAAIAVASSVILQTAYHLYQGIFSAAIYSVIFLVFSWYYVKSRRILPIILAHFYFDLTAVIAYSLR